MLLEELRQFAEVDFSGLFRKQIIVGLVKRESRAANGNEESGGGAGSIKKGAWKVERKRCRVAPKELCRAGDRSEAGVCSGRGCPFVSLKSQGSSGTIRG